MTNTEPVREEKKEKEREEIFVVDDSDSEEEVDEDALREQVEETEADLHHAKRELNQARFEEREHHREKGTWDDERGLAVKVDATWSFWKGSDWSAEEKRNLKTARTAIGVGVVAAIGTVSAASVGVFAAKENLDAAEERLNTTPSNSTAYEMNQDLLLNAQGSLAQSASTLYGAFAAAVGVLTGGIVMYVNTCAKHAETVKDLNRPEITKKRERMEAWVQELTEKLNAEREKLRRLVSRHKILLTEDL
jgi:hypothetical protein